MKANNAGKFKNLAYQAIKLFVLRNDRFEATLDY
ncbi:MAG: hypothetical protein ACI9XU_002286 [Arenicella sp.]|jgi:hypothetical protein